MADVGTGVAISFGTSGFTADILSVNGNAISRAVLDTTKASTSGAREKMPGDLVDHGEVELEFLFDPDTQPPISQAAETITITFPLPSGLGSPQSSATLAGTGFISAWSWGVPVEELMTATATITWDGATDPAWTASSG